MEACLHFRGVALNASEAGISRATECWRSTPHCGSEGDYSSPVGTEGYCKLESYDFGAEWKRLKSPDRCLFNRAIASYEWLRSFADAQATSSMTVAFVERRRGQVRFIYTTKPSTNARLVSRR